LFGSQATGKAHEHSDIDVAVVCSKVPRNRGYLDKKMKLWELTIEADSRIEPILLEEKDLDEKEPGIMGYEVLKHGILVV
jgi:predicted nucleotidyltransferase